MPDSALQRLVELVRILRSPEGCPWDREQGLENVRAYLLEEAHEVAAALDEGDRGALAGELGDLAFQLVFTAELLREEDGTTLDSILERIRTKMIERHPHVFGDEVLDTSDEVHRAWESRKAARAPAGASVLDGVPGSLPALLAAFRMGEKAAGVGFDWDDPGGALDKVEEEVAELRRAMSSGDERSERMREELGDLLLAIANLGRHLGIDPEAALASANLKFRRRFAHVEQAIDRCGASLGEAGPEELERLWEDAKRSARPVDG